MARLHQEVPYQESPHPESPHQESPHQERESTIPVITALYDGLKPDHARRQKIGLLGGSFNPAHTGHRDISLAAMNALGLDGVVWLVSPGNPLKDQSLYADYEVRMRQASQISNHEKIHVSDFEKTANLRYSAQTIMALQEAHSDVDFVWLLGADSFADLHLWRDWEEIFHLIAIVVLNRPGYEGDALKGVAARAFARFQKNPDGVLQSNLPAWCFIEETQNPLSSTAIRASTAVKSSTCGQVSTVAGKIHDPDAHIDVAHKVIKNKRKTS